MTTGEPLVPVARPAVPAAVAETRRQVLRATAELIDRTSYDAVTVDAVARAAGVSRSTVYRHWPTRQALVLEAFTHHTEQMTVVPDTGDALADLRTYLLKLAFCLGHGGAASTVPGLIADAVRDDELSHALRATMVQGRRREFFAILERGQQRGQLRRDADLATVVDALYGAVHHRLLVTRQPIDEPFVTALVRFAGSGLVMPPQQH